MNNWLFNLFISWERAGLSPEDSNRMFSAAGVAEKMCYHVNHKKKNLE